MTRKCTRLGPALALVIGALAVAAAGCGGGGNHPNRAVPQGFVGVTAGEPFIDGKVNNEREAARMASVGVESLRLPFRWSEMQPFPALTPAAARKVTSYPLVNGVPTNFSTTDRMVQAAAQHGITVLPVVLGTPVWAARHRGNPNSPPAGTAPFAAFMRGLVQRYGPQGTFWAQHPDVPRRPIRDWQIWNEPDHLAYWSDQPFARDYVRLLRAAHTAVHAADPGARVVLAGFANRSWDLLAQVYAAGGRGTFDVAAIHPYTLEVGNVMRIIRYARAVMAHNQDPRPLMLTEITWASSLGHTKVRFGYETTEAGQASRLASLIPQIVSQRKQLGIDRFYWETWISRDSAPNPVDYGGLRELQPSGAVRDKPALAAYGRVARQLEGCVKSTNAAHCR